MKLKVFIVTFNDGYNGDLPERYVIATDEESAQVFAKEQYPQYKNLDCWATELEFEGYKVIVEHK